MYIPPPFRVSRTEEMFDAIDRWNFGLLISAIDSRISTSYLPFVLDRENQRLLAHFAKANEHWKQALDAGDVLVSFQGPHCYVSPSWYRHSNLVPTWNYLSIQVSGKIQHIESQDKCQALINTLVEQHEKSLSTPWNTESMDSTVLTSMMQAIICVEISIDHIEGKAKLSQNRSLDDRTGVIQHLEQSTTDDEQQIAELMTQALSATKEAKS